MQNILTSYKKVAVFDTSFCLIKWQVPVLMVRPRRLIFIKLCIEVFCIIREQRFSPRRVGVHFDVADGHASRVLVCVFGGLVRLDGDRGSSEGLTADDAVAIAVCALGGAVLGASVVFCRGCLVDLTAELVVDVDFGAHIVSVI